LIGKAMKMARSPDGAAQAFYALFSGYGFVERDLEGTCFVCDKPRGGRLTAALRLRC
jgi:hypothetical protein